MVLIQKTEKAFSHERTLSNCYPQQCSTRCNAAPWLSNYMCVRQRMQFAASDDRRCQKRSRKLNSGFWYLNTHISEGHFCCFQRNVVHMFLKSSRGRGASQVVEITRFTMILPPPHTNCPSFTPRPSDRLLVLNNYNYCLAVLYFFYCGPLVEILDTCEYFIEKYIWSQKAVAVIRVPRKVLDPNLTFLKQIIVSQLQSRSII